jgi:hypothetical protein
MRDVFASIVSYTAASLLSLWYSLVQKCVSVTIYTIASVEDYLISGLLASTDIPEQNNVSSIVQGGSNMTGTNCDLFTHK